LRNERKHC